jgi:hypothetical protein
MTGNCSFLAVSEMLDVNCPISDDGATVAPRRSSLRRWTIRSILFFIVAGIAFGLWCAYDGISASLHAERVLGATRWTIEAAEDYVKAHDGAWPRSWEDLEQSSNHMKDVYGMTGGRKHVQEFVSVDFGADPDPATLTSLGLGFFAFAVSLFRLSRLPERVQQNPNLPPVQIEVGSNRLDRLECLGSLLCQLASPTRRRHSVVTARF